MKKAPIPKNENERLLSLHAMGLLDTKPEKRFDRITRLATEIFHVPISTLTLVDAQREWFKSCQGLPDREGDRAISFCGHALLAQAVFVIPDTKKDKRFSDNPMVIGKPFIRFYAGVPILNTDGQRIGVFCIKDTKTRTFSKQDEDVLTGLAAWAELEINSRNLSAALLKEGAVDKAKSEFVSLASHQLRTPLSVVNWYTEMLLAGDVGRMNEKQKKYLHEVYKGNQRMVELVNALLNVSRLEIGTFMLEPVPTNVIALARSVVDEQKPLTKAKRIKVTQAYVHHLPLLDADPKLLRMVIQNLFSNSVKYVPEKGKIRLEIHTDTKNLFFTITDNGCGIPKGQKAKVFDKMFRADNVRERDVEGTGLGLYIVKLIIDRYGGRIWFESEENKGSVFHVKLPLRILGSEVGVKPLA